MFVLKLTTAGLLGLIAATALAQAPAVDPAGVRAGLENGDRDSLPRSNNASNIAGGNTTAEVAPTLPSPGLGTDAAVGDYLRSARLALVAGETGKAQQSLEMAETRALTGMIPQAGVTGPESGGRVSSIHNALQALGAGDSSRAIALIDVALAN